MTNCPGSHVGRGPKSSPSVSGAWGRAPPKLAGFGRRPLEQRPVNERSDWMPANAGIQQGFARTLDSRLRGKDKTRGNDKTVVFERTPISRPFSLYAAALAIAPEQLQPVPQQASRCGVGVVAHGG